MEGNEIRVTESRLAEQVGGEKKSLLEEEYPTYLYTFSNPRDSKSANISLRASYCLNHAESYLPKAEVS